MATRSSYSIRLDRRKFVGAGALALAGAMSAASAEQQDALKAAADTLSATPTKTLQFTSSGADFAVGQNFTSDDPWPRVAIKRYVASISYEAGSMGLDLVRKMRRDDATRRQRVSLRACSHSGRCGTDL